jgi:uncharacterized protein YcnI
MFSTRRALALGAGAAGLLLATAGAASAHVTASPGESAAGGYTVLDFGVPHGCDGSPTTAVAIQIPEGVTSVKPTVVAGWKIDIDMETLATPLDDGHGGKITERTASVTYTATAEPLDDAYRQVFPVSMKMPDEAGTTLAFPVVQTCVQGETAWITVPEEGKAEPEHPAPVVVLTAASGDGHGSTTDTSNDEGGSDDAPANGTGDDGSTSEGDSDDGSSNGLAAAALVVGGLGLGAGGLALARSRR